MSRAFLLIFTLVAVAGAITYLNRQKPDRGDASPAPIITTVTMSAKEKEKQYPRAIELSTIDGYINTPSTSSGQATPITIGELVGKKVIMLDIWTYSCINCQRTVPYLNAWYEKYKEQGLEIIGLHTPEFEFEKDYANVKKAVEKFGIKYPVVLDNDFSTWRAYKNQYWPRKYLIDIDGFVVYDHIGEGAYDETEKKIQELLKERMEVLNEEGSVAGDIARPAVQTPDPSKPRSPEIYFGSLRNERLANGAPGQSGVAQFSPPAEAAKNELYLVGQWDVQPEFARNKTAGAKILFRYQAKDVYFVSSADKEVKVRVLRDSKPVKDITVREDGLYHLIADEEYGEHTLELIIDSPGLKAFTFTFG